jgi:hypothetical protein
MDLHGGSLLVRGDGPEPLSRMIADELTERGPMTRVTVGLT